MVSVDATMPVATSATNECVSVSGTVDADEVAGTETRD